MTKEELKQFNKELDEYEEKIKQPASKLKGKLRRAENLNYQDAKLIKEYGDKISDLEKENAELKSQIEKMKCCENCKFKNCNKSNSYQTCWYCKNKDKWKLRR